MSNGISVRSLIEMIVVEKAKNKEGQYRELTQLRFSVHGSFTLAHFAFVPIGFTTHYNLYEKDGF